MRFLVNKSQAAAPGISRVTPPSSWDSTVPGRDGSRTAGHRRPQASSDPIRALIEELKDTLY